MVDFCARKVWLWCILTLVSGINGTGVYAQGLENVYQSESEIDVQNEKKLFVEVDNMSFFKNNEYDTDIVRGYTLPGFRLQAKAIYYPVENVRLEGGFHSLWYWGSNEYPVFAYDDIPRWREDDKKSHIHLLPYLRAQAKLSDRVTVVLGNLYGGANHRLIEPLYDPELNLTADPEAGFQVLYKTPWLDLDTWINWETFIYKKDTRQEALLGGLSARFKSARPESRFEWYFPFQAIAHHLGGQIDVTGIPVTTMLNGAAGAGLNFHPGQGALKKISAELDVTGFYLKHREDSWAFNQGYGIYASLSADISDFKLKSSYWQCDDFISVLGSPLFGVSSAVADYVYFKRPRMVSTGAEYTRDFGRGVMFGAEMNIFYRLESQIVDPDRGVSPFGAKVNCSIGIYLRVNPSFLIKAF
ncbi:MAG: hypothetical protein LBN71_02690 [Tannerella sp.]|jgi:hypothetical protein|nr:hypothetical protein [Tannerella sp.]